MWVEQVWKIVTYFIEFINIDFIEIFTGPNIPIIATATPLNPEPDSTAIIQYPLRPILIQSPPTALPTLRPIEEQLMVMSFTLKFICIYCSFCK